MRKESGKVAIDRPRARDARTAVVQVTAEMNVGEDEQT
jgi:hypothetical protein